MIPEWSRSDKIPVAEAWNSTGLEPEDIGRGNGESILCITHCYKQSTNNGNKIFSSLAGCSFEKLFLTGFTGWHKASKITETRRQHPLQIYTKNVENPYTKNSVDDPRCLEKARKSR